MNTPADINISDGLLSTFGCIEYEEAMCEIVKFLRDPKAEADRWIVGLGSQDLPWGKKFRADTFPEIDKHLFAMLCADGWITASHFPKYAFMLSTAAVERLSAHVPYAERRK